MLHLFGKLRYARHERRVLFLAVFQLDYVHRFYGVVKLGKQLLEARYLARQLAGFLGHFLRVLDVVPEPFRVLQGFELRNACTQFVGVYTLKCGV